MKKIGCTLWHKWTGAFAICDKELLNDSNWEFFSNQKIKF